MVIGLAFTTKAALTMGVVVGGTIAVVSNMDKILELLAELLQKGADFCNEQIEKNKIQMASQMDDGELDFDQEREVAEEGTSTGFKREGSVALESEHETDRETDSARETESETEGILTDGWDDSDMDGWQLAHLSESEFSESYDEIDSEPVSRATSGISSVSSYGRMSSMSVD